MFRSSRSQSAARRKDGQPRRLPGHRGQLLYAVDVAGAHPAAADDGEVKRIHTGAHYTAAAAGVRGLLRGHLRRRGAGAGSRPRSRVRVTR